MPLIEVVDPDPSGSGYKFDLMDSESREVVKVFATRDALLKAIDMSTPPSTFDVALRKAANEKFERDAEERDGAILISADDLLA